MAKANTTRSVIDMAEVIANAEAKHVAEAEELRSKLAEAEAEAAELAAAAEAAQASVDAMVNGWRDGDTSASADDLALAEAKLTRVQSLAEGAAARAAALNRQAVDVVTDSAPARVVAEIIRAVTGEGVEVHATCARVDEPQQTVGAPIVIVRTLDAERLPGGAVKGTTEVVASRPSWAAGLLDQGKVQRTAERLGHSVSTFAPSRAETRESMRIVLAFGAEKIPALRSEPTETAATKWANALAAAVIGQYAEDGKAQLQLDGTYACRAGYHKTGQPTASVQVSTAGDTRQAVVTARFPVYVSQYARSVALRDVLRFLSDREAGEFVSGLGRAEAVDLVAGASERGWTTVLVSATFTSRPE